MVVDGPKTDSERQVQGPLRFSRLLADCLSGDYDLRLRLVQTETGTSLALVPFWRLSVPPTIPGKHSLCSWRAGTPLVRQASPCSVNIARQWHSPQKNSSAKNFGKDWTMVTLREEKRRWRKKSFADAAKNARDDGLRSSAAKRSTRKEAHASWYRRQKWPVALGLVCRLRAPNNLPTKMTAAATVRPSAPARSPVGSRLVASASGDQDHNPDEQ